MVLVLVADLDVRVTESLDAGLEELQLGGKGEHLLSPRTNGWVPGKYNQRWSSGRKRDAHG
jgi:hypothetical protein